LEVKINREIRAYKESVFFGLSMRQCMCGVLACGVAVGTYFAMKTLFGTETISWVCIMAAFPFAAIGFVTYNGMHLEQLLKVWFKSKFLIPKRLVSKPENFYYAMMQMPDTPQKPKKKQKKEAKSHAQKSL